MAALSAASVVATINGLKTAIDYIRTQLGNAQVVQLREALAELYFKAPTVDALRSMATALDEETLRRHADIISSRMWETRMSTGDALQLLEAASRSQFGLSGQRLVDEIRIGKLSLRKAVAHTCFIAARDGDGSKLQEILTAVEKLNRSLEELDDKLGGVFLTKSVFR